MSQHAASAHSIDVSQHADSASRGQSFVHQTLAREDVLSARRIRDRAIGLYRENAIAIESEARDPFGGNVYYVTMQITFPIPEFPRKERNLHCDVVHITTKWVSRLVLDHAIAAIQTSR